MASLAALQDVTGSRGEKMAELCLTRYSAFTHPLFKPGFLGDKWPTIDLYVELEGLKKNRPYFFAQCKATGRTQALGATSLNIQVTKRDISRLLNIPGPTYIIGVHEPTQRVFARSVHAGIPRRGMTTIRLVNELTDANLRALYDEVRTFWRGSNHKPHTSAFL